MADSEEIKKQAEAQKEVNQETRNFTQEAQEGLRFTRDINSEIRDRLQLLKGEKDLRNSTLKALKEANNLAEEQIDLAKAGSKALMDSSKLREKQFKFQQNIAKLQANADDLELKRKYALNTLINNRSKMTQDEIKAEQQKIKDAQTAQRGIQNQITNQEANLEILDQQVEAADELNSLGSNKLFSSLSAIAGAIPGVKNLTKGFDKAAEASKNIGADMLQKKLEDGKDASLTMGEALSAGFKGGIAGANELLKAFGPIAILGKVFQGMMKADKSTSAIAQGLNESYDAAELTSKSIIKIKNNSDDALITYGGLKHALLDINTALGTSAMISGETLKTFDKLNKTAGLTSDQLMGIGKISFATGKDLRGQTDQFLKQVKTTKDQYKVSLNSKQILTEISKTSAATQLSLGLSVEELAKAATTAKAFGMNLEQVENIAGSLLDFESSIEKELEAELMLGKNINLEKARQAALNNDLATVAEEIAKQAGTSAEFSKMNRLQQEAIAGAVGMSREDLAQTLFTQEQLAGLSEEDQKNRKKTLDYAIEKYGVEEANRMIEEDGIATLEAQASKQAEMAAAAERMNETFMELGKNLTPILEGVSGMVQLLSRNVELVMAGVAAYKTMSLAMKANAALQTILNAKEKGMLGKKLASLGLTAARSAAAIPVIGFGLAAAAGLAAFALGKSLIGKAETADDFMSPGEGSGYGNRIITSPEGTFALNNKDTVIAGTNLDQNSGGNASSIKLEQLQAQTNTLLSQLLNKNASIKMDSEELGTAISLNNYEISA